MSAVLKLAPADGRPAPVSSKLNRNLIERNGMWYVSLKHSGKRYLRSTGYSVGNIKEARAFRDLFKKQLRDSDLSGIMAHQVRPGYATFGDVREGFQRVALAHNLKPDTVRNYWVALSSVVHTTHTGSLEELSTGILTADLAREYRDRVLKTAGDNDTLRRRAAITVRSTLRNARCFFSAAAIEEYGAMKLPDLRGFMLGGNVSVQDNTYTMPERKLIDKTITAGRALKTTNPTLYTAFILCYDCALRAGEAAGAEASWILDDCLEVRLGKTWSQRHIARRIPLNAETRAELLAAGARQHILDGPTRNQRLGLVSRALSTWMRNLGWDAFTYPKAAHELRKLMGSRWYTELGPQVARDLLGHKDISTTCKYYAALDRRPPALAREATA